MCEVNWAVVLEFTKLLFSWPAVVAGALMWAARSFKPQLTRLIDRIKNVKYPGGEVQMAPFQGDGPVAGALEVGAELVAIPAANVAAPALEELPPELQDDPLAPGAIVWIRQNAAETLIEYKKTLSRYNFERLYARIYGTQWALLEYLLARPDRTTMVDDLTKFWDQHRATITQTDYQYTFVHFLAFLTSFGVLQPNGLAYTLTQTGAEFLSYIKGEYPTNYYAKAY